MAQAPFLYRSAGACPPRWPSSSYVFRSFRTYMSIAARVVPFSRAFRTLIQRHRGEPLHIKVLQTLGCSVVQDAIDIKVLQTLGMARETRSPARGVCEGPRPTVNGDDFLGVTVARGTGPRALSSAAENARSPVTTDVCCSDRCMARDRPSPCVLLSNRIPPVVQDRLILIRLPPTHGCSRTTEVGPTPSGRRDLPLKFAST